jgi:hypothetical protein
MPWLHAGLCLKKRKADEKALCHAARRAKGTQLNQMPSELAGLAAHADSLENAQSL